MTLDQTFSQGGKVSKYNLSKEEEEKVLLTAKKIKGKYVGVDFIPTKEINPKIIEVNHSPFLNIEEATGENVIGQVVGLWKDETTREHVAEEQLSRNVKH